MSAHCLLLGLTLSLLMCRWATPAPADEVIDIWRSPFSTVRSTSVGRAVQEAIGTRSAFRTV